MRKLLYIAFGLTALVSCSKSYDNCVKVNYKPTIYPDYTDVVIPVNIAPLNFKLVNNTDLLKVEVKTKKQTV